MGLGEVHPFVTLEAEELGTEVLQKQEEEEEELGILQYLDQLEQVTARYFSRLVLCYQYGTYKKCSLSYLFLVLFYFSHKVKLKEIFSLSVDFSL